MILTEFFGKELLYAAGLNIPKSILLSSEEILIDAELTLQGKLQIEKQINSPQNNFSDSFLQKFKELNFPVFVKAQVSHGNRELNGLVQKVDQLDNLEDTILEIFSKTDIYGQKVNEVLVEESVSFSDQIYLSIGYDTRTRTPVVSFSAHGGTGMDDRGDSLETMPISLTQELKEFPPMPELLSVVRKLIQVFSNNDATVVEINPLVRAAGKLDNSEISFKSDGLINTGNNVLGLASLDSSTGLTLSNNNFFCLDSKIELEDVAAYRHEEWSKYNSSNKSFSNSAGKVSTEMEIKAYEISNMDHRGVAGESFFEFEDGDIGVMASGGGASVLAMDALLLEGLKPANYTEYSGNPVREKVKALANLILSMPDLKALYVVGSNANFTDIYETLSGVVDGLMESSYALKSRDVEVQTELGVDKIVYKNHSNNIRTFKVLIRRGGPRWEEAFAMVKERLAGSNFELKLFGPDFPIVETAVELRKMLEN